MPGSSSDEILSSWQVNSQSWITTIDQNEIVSRQLATNNAIVNAVEQHQPLRILDVGCGEGWLSRAIYAPHRIVIGIDGVEELVSNATKKGGGPAYACFNYEGIRQGKLPSWEPFDLIVFNFALFEDQATFILLNQLKQLLVPRGHLLVQTIALPAHEFSGWRTEDWHSMKTNYPAPFPWYYRERDEWKKDAQQNGWKVHRFTDIVHPENKQLLSCIIELKVAF